MDGKIERSAEVIQTNAIIYQCSITNPNYSYTSLQVLYNAKTSLSTTNIILVYAV